MGVREMLLISPTDLERLKSKEPTIKTEARDFEEEAAATIEDKDDEIVEKVVEEDSTGLHLLGMALEGVNPRYKSNAFQLLKHLSFINQTSKRFLFDTSDFGVILDGKKIPKSNLVEIINTAFKRSGPIASDEQYEREKQKLNIPGFYAFLRVLGSIGIPSSMFNNQIVASFVRRSRQ